MRRHNDVMYDRQRLNKVDDFQPNSAHSHATGCHSNITFQIPTLNNSNNAAMRIVDVGVTLVPFNVTS
jgi:hypothetical protein